MVGDLLSAALAMTLMLRFQVVASLSVELVLLVLASTAWVGLLAMGRAYDQTLFGEGHEEYRRIAISGVTAIGTVGVVASIGHWHWGGAAIFGLAAATALTLVWRRMVRGRLHSLRTSGIGMNRAVLVGTTEAVEHMAALLAKSAHHGTLVVGAVLPWECALPNADLVWDARAGADITMAAVDMGADEVILLNALQETPERVRDLMWSLAANDIGLMVAPVNLAVAGPRLALRPVDGLPLLNVAHPQLSGMAKSIKTTSDRVIAGLGLIGLSPLLLLIALTIRTTSPGPALFRQIRVGEDGRQFSMYKFRSMVPDAEDRLLDLRAANHHGADGRLFKIPDDPRITRIGKVLRRYSLDELPQLINVIKGDMSLVGPRPPLPSEVAHYTRHGWFRMKARPGLTGLWQVSGRSNLDPDASLELDLRYVENWSLSLDAVILWKTARAVVSSAGAY